MAAAYAAWGARADHLPARVAVEFNHLYRVYVDGGEVDAVVSGRLKHHAASRGDLPAVGDWVVARKKPDEGRASIVHILPRRSHFSRKAAGSVTDEQVVAANVDVVFLVMGLDGDFSPRRLERYLLANGPTIPRTTVRYAIERFPERKRRELLAATRRDQTVASRS